jgi:glycosyltransferase involved in cell wall biosynthesis
LGFRVGFVPGGVDVERFSPVPAERKAALRAKHELNPSAFTILHVGHVSGLRNIESLPWVKQALACQVILVASSLHSENQGLLDSLRERGVIVLDRYLPKIEEVYQLSDCYLFPVVSEQASIEVPLSVLEAMACNLPVVSTRFGGLPELFQEGEGLFFAASGVETLSALERVRSLDCCRTREKVLPYSWQAVAGRVISLARAEGVR